MDKLIIKDLTVSVDDKVILKDFNLEIKSGEIHVIMGPNGTGKSTLTKVILGDKNYQVLKGEVLFNNTLLNDLTTDERARLGIFLGMQNPMEIEGVTNADFLRTAISTKDKDNFKLFDFIKELDKTVEYLSMSKDMIHRGINQGFSGGEKKKNEILQMYMLKPKCILLDEIDSGLDVDSLKIVGNSVMDYFNKKHPSILVITHYQRLLDYIKPTHVHIMKDGTIIKSGGAELVKEVEQDGYNKQTKKVSSIGTCVVKEMIKDE